MKGYLKGLTGAIAFMACVVCLGINVYAGTGIYVGKDVSSDGSIVIGASTEARMGILCMPEVYEKGRLKKGDVINCENGFSYTLPEDSAKLILTHTLANTGYGSWNATATNEYGVSVVATLTVSPCAEAIIADPLVPDGIGEEQLALIVASTSKTAKEAVDNLCLIFEEKGAATPEIVLIADQEGAWAVENFTGHEYVAVKLPDDKMATFGNDPIIKTADPKDPDTICSSKLLTLPEENGFAVYDENKNIDLVLTYNLDNQYYDESHLRGWAGHDMFAPSEKLEYAQDKEYDVFFSPDEKVSMPQTFGFFRNRYEGTKFDLSIPDNNYYWGINNQYVGNVSIIQIFDEVPAQISSVLWTTPANPTASPFIPIPSGTDEIPESFSKDLEEEMFNFDCIQHEFASLNNDIYPRRNLYGASVRKFWEGLEAISVNHVTENVRGSWNDDYSESSTKALGAFNDYVKMVVDSAQENCERITEEFEWYLINTGIWMSSVSDEELIPFECSGDAADYAHVNGWDTVVNGNVFTATKDGKTIEIVFDGDEKGNITFTGFDNETLEKDFFGDDSLIDESDEEKADDKEKTEEVKEETKEEVKEEPAEEKSEDKKEEKKEESASDKDAKEEVTEQAAKQLEVDTLAELESYFGEKIANVPRDGWAEGDIAKQLAGVSDDVVGIIGKYFNGNIEDIMGLDVSALASDKDVADVGNKLAETGVDLSALIEKYFVSLADDVTEDVVSGRLTQEGAVKILTEAETDVEGIAKLYLDGLAGTFAEVFDTSLSEEELTEALSELTQGALDIMDEYGVVDLDELGLGDLDVEDLTDADINVVITLNEMDDDVIDGLSDLLGVDVRATLDQYMEMISNTAPDALRVIEEKHETQKANAEPAEEIAAVQELEKALTEEDIEIPQEVIDILNEAINEAAGNADESDQPAEADTLQNGNDDGSFKINVSSVREVDGKILIPSSMLRYFD